jgi:hypothetical protein
MFGASAETFEVADNEWPPGCGTPGGGVGGSISHVSDVGTPECDVM